MSHTTTTATVNAMGRMYYHYEGYAPSPTTLRTLETIGDEYINTHDMTNNDNLLEWIAIYDIHGTLTKSIIKRIASNQKHVSNKACLSLINNNYKEAIFDDIKQDIFICLMRLISEGFCTFDCDNNWLKFADYTNADGKQSNYYVELYRTIQKTLAVYRNNNNSNEVILCDYTGVSDDENEVSGTWNNPLYIKYIAYEGGLNDILNNVSFINIMKHIKKEVTPKQWDKVVNVVEGLISGLTTTQIANKYHYTEGQVRRTRETIHTIYNNYSHKIEISHVRKNTFGGGIKNIYTTINNGSITTGGGYKVGMF